MKIYDDYGNEISAHKQMESYLDCINKFDSETSRHCPSCGERQLRLAGQHIYVVSENSFQHDISIVCINCGRKVDDIHLFPKRKW